MLNDLAQDAAAFIHSDWGKFALAGLGLAAWVGIYYIGEYLFGERDPDLETEEAIEPSSK
jgi:hypothetical protein